MSSMLAFAVKFPLELLQDKDAKDAEANLSRIFGLVYMPSSADSPAGKVCP